MKLVRWGRAGAEKPGMIDAAGGVRDLSRVVKDITADVLSPASLKRLRGLKVERLPLVRGRPRLGCPLTGIGKMVCIGLNYSCLLYTSPSPRDGLLSRMPSSA